MSDPVQGAMRELKRLAESPEMLKAQREAYGKVREAAQRIQEEQCRLEESGEMERLRRESVKSIRDAYLRQFPV